MSYGKLSEREPAALVGAIASAIGFLVLTGADVDALQSLGTAVGIAVPQGVLSRQRVFSGATVRDLASSKPIPPGLFSQLLDVRGGHLQQREPVVMTGGGVLLAGFLVQFFAGVGMVESLTSAAGIVGAQALATRSQVYSPASARGVALSSIAADFRPDEIREARALA